MGYRAEVVCSVMCRGLHGYIRKRWRCRGWGPLLDRTFPGEWGEGGEGATPHPNIYNVIFFVT